MPRPSIILDWTAGRPVYVRCSVNTFSNTKSRNEFFLIIDTGANRTALSMQSLLYCGYTHFTPPKEIKNTAGGKCAFKQCTVSEFVVANKFKQSALVVDVFDKWNHPQIVGALGMDILAKLTAIWSSKDKKVLL